MTIEIKLAGKVVQRSRNLRGIITRAHKIGVAYASVISVYKGRGSVYIRFIDGSECQTDFASFTVARHWLRSRWRRWGLWAEVRNSDTYWVFLSL